ncbi:MAG TPA: PhzF family phenazine biosynthesis protein [Gemmatimonadales bacterium]
MAAPMLPLYLIDAFTAEPFAGNPAAVCLLDGERPDRWLQAVATEMNQAETAFLLRSKNGFDLRWFTPASEVDLCGHATLASAHFLWEEGYLRYGEAARFQTRSGLLTATRDAQWITLDFPATPPEACEVPPQLLPSLGLSGVTVLRSRFDYFVVLEDPAPLHALRPDARLLSEVATRGVIVTTPSDRPEADFLSRFFAPGIKVDEDPVTGSAHCALAPYWGARLGKASLIGYQASARGGTVKVELAGDRVLLGGKAVTTVKGSLLSEAGSFPRRGSPR